MQFVYMFWWSTTYLAMLPGVTSFSACSSGIWRFLVKINEIDSDNYYFSHLKTKFVLNSHDHLHMIQTVQAKVLKNFTLITISEYQQVFP